ncbi:hypothetical protein ACIPWF_19275 [Paenarthrobacter sp. NPDC089989]|uniref:hypothetical protein n=1 Tax=unclassified Paenarthrobacter TaxID=2634190 RepID=UPI003808A991
MIDDQWGDLPRELIDAIKDDAPSVTDWISAVSTALTLLIAIGAGVVAFFQLREAASARRQTKQLEREKSQPYVVAYLEENPVGPHILDLVVKNFGQTAGRNVRLSFDPALNRTDDNGGEEAVGLPDVISFLAPGQEWRTFFDVSTVRAGRDNFPMTYKGIVTYDGIDGECQNSDVVIDLHHYKARIYTEVFGIHHAARALRDIRDNQKKWNESVHGGFRVYSRDGTTKDEEQARKNRQYREARAAERTEQSSYKDPATNFGAGAGDPAN